jgi:hypothetical protein
VEAAITAATSPLATAANLATVAGYLDTEIAAILADTNELQTDWVDGGRLDQILDARASQASVDDVPTVSELTASQAALLAYLASAHGAGSWATATGFSTHAAADVITLLGSGTQVYGHSYLESIKRIEVVSGAATLTGAGTGTEVMTSSDASKTVTFTVDGSGNISAAVWT